MQKLIIIILLAVALFGCLGVAEEEHIEDVTNVTPEIAPEIQPEEKEIAGEEIPEIIVEINESEGDFPLPI